MPKLLHLRSVRLPRIRTRRALIAAALGAQLLVLLVAWTLTFRHVRASIAERVGGYLQQQNAAIARELAALFPGPDGGPPEFGSPEWERYQRVVESAGAELAAGGFACVIDADGNILCHPDIREDASLRNVNLAGKINNAIAAGDLRKPTVAAIPAAHTDPASPNDAAYQGAISFIADGVHHLAVRDLPGGLRILVHQPEADLFGKANELTGLIITSGVVAIGAIMLVGGGALLAVIRSYDSTFEEINRRLKGALQIAREIQRSTLPAATPSIPGFDVAGWSESADETGGDTFDLIGLRRLPGGAQVVESDADALVCVLADATGHGVPAALAISEFRALVRAAVRAGVEPDLMMKLINDQLLADLPSDRFVTSWIGFLNADDAEVRTFAAGQGPIIVCRAADRTIQRLEPDNPPLGILDELEAGGAAVTLEPGDSLVVPSDGLFEAMTQNGDQFGLDRLEAVLADNAHRSASDAIDAVRHAVDAFTNAAPPNDDRTMIVIKRTA